MSKEKPYCVNCGGTSHCGKTFKRKESETINDKTIREWEIDVCKSCRCNKCDSPE